MVNFDKMTDLLSSVLPFGMEEARKAFWNYEMGMSSLSSKGKINIMVSPKSGDWFVIT